MGHDNIKPMDLEQECETWDWARTAGVSAQQLRDALSASPGQKAAEALAEAVS